MKHFLSYGADGQLIGIHTHRHAGTGLNGWPANCNMHNPNCQHEATKWFRANVIGKNGVVDFVKYECPCSPTATSCQCVAAVFANNRVVEGALVPKIEAALVLAGAPLENNSTLKRPPGVALPMRVMATGVPDGATAVVTQRGTVTVLDQQNFSLTFADGQTEEFLVYPPAQGLSGLFSVSGLLITPIGLYVTGWGA